MKGTNIKGTNGNMYTSLWQEGRKAHYNEHFLGDTWYLDHWSFSMLSIFTFTFLQSRRTKLYYTNQITKTSPQIMNVNGKTDFLPIVWFWSRFLIDFAKFLFTEMDPNMSYLLFIFIFTFGIHLCGSDIIPPHPSSSARPSLSTRATLTSIHSGMIVGLLFIVENFFL